MTDYDNMILNPMLNGRYELIKELGEGHTSTVYFALDHRTNTNVAVKIIKNTYLYSDNNARASVDDEIVVMKSLEHSSIVKLLEHGKKGVCVKPSGRVVENLVYIVMEYVKGELLFDFQERMNVDGNGMGEAASRFFFHQLLDTLEHMHNRGIIHRDLKPENIIVDENMNTKLLDFGFAAYQDIDSLTSYRGTMTYMAPEIKKGEQYKGSEIDIFSLGVVLFAMVRGLFPFAEAKQKDYWYNLIRTGQSEAYFAKIDKKNLLSAEFKSLIVAMFAE